MSLQAQGKGLILMYHRVARVHADPFRLCVTPKHFEEQMRVVHELGLAARLDQVDAPAAAGAIAVTFDDGYVDNLLAAKPVLERHAVPATFFITTGNLGEDREFWWDELERVFLEPGPLPQRLSLTISGVAHDFDLNVDDRAAVYSRVWRLLQLVAEAERRRGLDSLATWSGRARAREEYRSMTAAELRELAGSPLMEIGAHTVSHPALPDVPAAQQEQEITHSKAALEAILQRPVTSFAYPYGARSEQTIGLVREAGFARACSTVAGVIEEPCDRWQLPRVQVEDWDGAEFEKRLEAWFRGQTETSVPAEEPLLHGKWLFRGAGFGARLTFPAEDVVRIEVPSASTANRFDVQLNRPRLAVKEGRPYIVEFSARADHGRTLAVGFAQAHEPWEGLGLYATLELHADWRQFRLPFQAAADDGNGRIHFDAGCATDAVELRNVQLREA